MRRFFRLNIVLLVVLSALLLSCSNVSTTIPTAKYIPYGTYIHTYGKATEIIILRSDGTYMDKVGSVGTQKDGTYEVDNQYISLISEQQINKLQYSYSQQSNCLYLYKDTRGEYPTAYIKK
jgi:hypothetical protein